MSAELRALPPGEVVRLEAHDGRPIGTFAFNPHSLIAARRLDSDPAAVIDGAWISGRLAAAVALRSRLGLGPWHRLVHAEADGLPGLVIDRFDDVAVLQANTAWAERMQGEIAGQLAALLGLRALVARNDSPVRAHEGLAAQTALLFGDTAAAVVEEGGLRFVVDLLGGQKTGWFFDQRGNRDRVAALAAGARVLDVFCHLGGFGLRCAAAGAAAVTLVDASAVALSHALAAAVANGLASRVSVREGDAFALMAAAGQAGERYDIVVCDPPAFARSRKDQAAGLRAYTKMTRLAAPLVAPGGFLFVASCSHHAPAEAFAAAVADGLWRAGRGGRILASSGAGPDHPVHPELPESAYLKAELLQLD
jgi:23S rRNA (cytosine1962-C5)-methyltransferase